MYPRPDATHQNTYLKAYVALRERIEGGQRLPVDIVVRDEDAATAESLLKETLSTLEQMVIEKGSTVEKLHSEKG